MSQKFGLSLTLIIMNLNLENKSQYLERIDKLTNGIMEQFDSLILLASGTSSAFDADFFVTYRGDLFAIRGLLQKAVDDLDRLFYSEDSSFFIEKELKGLQDKPKEQEQEDEDTDEDEDEDEGEGEEKFLAR